MSKPIIIGITGQTGAGKTTISDFFRSMGMFIIDADIVSREVLIKYKEVIEKLKLEFGDDIVNDSGELNRKLLAFKAFKDKKTTKRLNSIMLKYIRLDIEEIIAKNINEEVIIIDAPLLFEGGLDKYCDAIISVIADEDIRLDRITKRDNITIDQAIRRMKIQNDADFFKRSSDFVLDGGKKKQLLLDDAEKLITQIKRGFCCE